jgi:amino acid adenylation domain-containing protein/non-ribosomal peptide synthase protein (TIGR01720 family)
MQQITESNRVIFDQGLIDERNYWIARLTPVVEASKLDLDAAGAHAQLSEFNPEAISLNGEVYQRLAQLTGGGPFLTYTVLMTAMSVCLQRYTGDDRVVIGSPSLKESDGSGAGNTLAIMTEVDPQVSFRQQLVSMRQTLLEAYERQNYPFKLLLQDLSLKDSPNSGPLFDIAMVFTGMHSELPETGNPLTLIFNQEQDRLSVRAIINDSRFSRDAITRFIGHFINLLSAALESIAADPEQRVGELRMLTPAEEQQVVEEWNETGRKYRREACIHELFAEQARRRPEAIAVIAEGEQVSYGELDQRANQVARRLRQLGVGPEVVVGICVERSVAMVVGLLGILKAGGAYLPLDSEYPQERLEYMIADAGVKVLLTQSELRERLPMSAGIECLEWSSDWFESSEWSSELESGASAETLAYVIYTSGSTGQPKGVAVPHRGVVRLVQESNYVKLDEEEVVLQMAPVSFDASTFEIWGALLNGARLVVMAAGQPSLAEIAETVKQHEVSTMWLTAGLFQVMATEQLESLREVKQLLAGGDVLSVRAVQAVLEGAGAGERVLINGYGPTENTTFSCCHVMRAGEAVVGESVLIGKPITNSTAYVLDEQLRPVPVGVRGELYLGGDGLARGYVGRAELTAEKFVPNPFSMVPGERLYRTGDVVRWNAEGLVEFIGRADQQVKVRGYRIELGEIEAVLNEQPSVKESIAVVIDDGAGNKRLVAYVVEEIGSDESVSELRQKVKEKLPEYMVPSQLIKLDAMPLTANGKVDRKALAAAEFELGQTRVYEAPRTAVEELLAGIWAEVLGLERVGIHDNFFELGGDSILSIQSIARANRNGLLLSPKDIFHHQTIAQLAAVAGTVTEVEAEQGLVMGAVSLTPIQHWFFEQELSEPHYFNQTLLLEIRESIEPELLGEAVQQIVLHHDALRLRFEHSASGWRQFHGAAEESLSFSAIDLSAVAESEQSAAIESEAAAVQASLNLTDGPVLRVVYFELGAGKPGRLLLVCHHLVVDGVSWRILLADLQEAYRALVAGETVQLPAKSSSFQQWTQVLSEYAKSSAVQEQLDYWLRAEREQVQNIPRDYEGENLVSSTAVVAESLGREETEALLQEVPGVYHTQINEVLLSALALALGKWSKQNVVLVDMEGHGREPISERVDVTRTVGWFTTIYPTLLEVAGSRDQVGEVVKQVKEQVRGIPGQGLGYGLLRYLGTEEVKNRLRDLPQAEVSFNYLGQIDRVLNEETLFGAASESSGSYRSETGSRRYLLEINAMTAGGRFQVSWSYSAEVHQRETVAALAAAYVQSLREIIAHCASEEAGGYTPSDFPLAQLTAGELEGVVGEQRRGIEDVYPLSPMQEGLLFHSLYAPQGGLYVEQVQNLFRGALDVAALRTAWERVQERHAILRSSFRWEGLRRPLQVVQQQAALPWEEEDWRGLSHTEQREKLEALLRADRERGFELTQAPLMRMTLLRLGESEWQFVWSFHHILLDGWCISLLLQEVFHFYEGYQQGDDVELGRARPYRDYIEWLAKQDLDAAESYWRNRLAGFRAPIHLGIDAESGSDDTKSYGEQNLELSKESTGVLEALAREQQVTLNTVVQGAWAVLLSRYSGERDVVYGVTVSGRPAELAGVEQMVGLFINTLPLRVEVGVEAEVGSWLQLLQAEQAELRQYEYSPLVEVQGWSEVERGTPLFETLLAFENYPVTKVIGEQSGSEAAVKYEQEWAMERTNYPLTLLVGPGERLLLRALYAEQHYAAETIERVLGHLEQILVSMAAGAQQRVSELRMLTPAEEQQVVEEWNETGREYRREACIHELFAEQARRRPEAIAVIAEGEQVSYGELDQRANEVARRLRQLGVGPEVVVGICVERSVELIVGLLGILKAGGAYLPLDAEYPQERLEYMIADAGVKVLLTQSELRERLPMSAGIECLELSSDWFESSEWSSELESGASAETLAYVIYTSGSTGQPKGVAVPHRGVVRLVQQSNYVKLDEEEVVLQLAPVSFDASTFEIWGALLNGARLVVMAAGQPSIAEIAETVKQHEVSTMWLTAGLFQVMATEQLESLREVKQLLAGGDVLSVRAVQAVLEGAGAGERVLINGYGPTENTTFSCCHVMRAGEAVVGESVLIGKPITNSTAYVLDEQLRPVPVGVRGELYLGGDGLARGYVGRAELTTERFIPNPFSTNVGERLYRTGDVVRWNAEGVLEFVGRADHQVKVRGYRIELGEVEEALAGFGISESVVVVRAEGEGEKRLVGYVVARAGVELDVSELGAYLETKLPGYMIPSVFVELTELPLTANGKVDRKALAAAELELSGKREYEAPRTAVEKLLAGIWAEVLGVERVGIHDNFFELGGHSLLATQVISRVRETFRLELPLRSLFEAPQLSDFASTVEQAMRGEQQVEAPPLVPVGRERVLPLSFAQQRLWFLDQLEPFSSAYHIPAAVRLSGTLKLEALERSFAEITRRHEALRTVFTMRGGNAVQEILPAGQSRLEVIDLSQYSAEEQKQEVHQRATAEAAEPFDLSHGPLLRVKVLRLSESEHVLLLIMHHIICDGWSMAVLMQELIALYDVYGRGESSSLPELPIQYADYAVWQREWLQGDVLAEQLDYWRQQLRGAPAVLELPSDRARPKVQSYRGATAVIALSEELSERLKHVSREQGATLFITLLAAFQTLLSRYSGTNDVVVGSPIANRNRSEIELLIGFFVNTLVLRARVKRDEPFTELVKQVREVCLGAYAHQDVPFEQLVEELQPERSLSYQPLCQVLFALQNAPQEKREVAGLSFAPVEFESRSCRCDLTVSMSEVNGRLQGLVEYSTDLFEEATISRMLGHFTNLLESIVADPEQRVGELRMLDVEEERQVITEWNETRREYAREACIHELFAEQARRRPEAIAVIADGEQVSYGELDQRANQVARRLQQLGVGPEVVVGICVERSVAMVVGLLGILKAGGAYLPLDAEYPQERLEYMLSDAGVKVLLTQSELRERLPVSDGIECLELSDWFASEAGEPESGASAETLAYVIYTSGSTGQPKGVAVPHRGVVRLVQQSNYVKLDEEEVVLQLAPVSFDASTFEIWGALLNGARLVVMAAGQPSLAEIAQTMKRHEVSTMWLTAGLFQVMATEQLESLREVKQLLAGGDVLGVRAVQAVLDGESGARVLINGYGPTENTTFSCCHVMRAGEAVVGESVLIGRPITNSTAYVLDEQLRPVPVGVRGELYLGGDGLARGYVGRAELTAERFVPNPFSTNVGERLYRTGDVVRWNAEGVLEFVGRADHQVKVRGYRIELGEVEEALAGFEGVSESVVVVRTEGEGEKRLVGYVVARAGAELEVSELRAYLETKLPAYMIPSVFVELTELPLTANGKVDRKSLAAAEFELMQSRVYEAPRTAVEELLAGIWAEVLGVERVGIHDNFFELGGDSILSIQSIARANQAGLQLSPKDLFEHQTVAQLAAVAGIAAEVVAEQGLVTGSVTLTPIQHWFFEQEISDPHHFNQTLLLEVREALDPEVLAQAVSQLVLHHDALRLRYERSESGWSQYHKSAEDSVSFCTMDLTTVPASEQSAAIEAEAALTQASLNLSAGPLLRVVYFDLGAGRAGRLLLVCHHLVVDGVSWRILLADLQEAYRALLAGEAVQLPAKSSSFQQWSQALTEYASGEEVAAQAEYWLRAEREQVLGIPRDYDGENLVSSTSVVVESLSREETEALLQEVPGVYHTQINEVLLSGLALALGEWSESRVVLVDVEGHGREPISERVDVSRTVGWFTTIYPVLLEVNGNRDQAGEVVKQVKEQVRGIPGQGLGYGVLRYLGSDEVAKRLRELPHAEVSFNYLGQIDRVLNEETLFGAASESSGNYRSENGNRRYLVEINAMIAGGRLQVSWSYSSQVHERETIAAVAAAYVQSLRSIIEHCASAEAGGYTPSDFPLAQLSAAELAAVIGEQRRGIEDIYPLSPMQQGLLFHSLYAPQGGLYVEQVQNRFRGALDLKALRTAWERVQERHAILRSGFRWEGLRRPLQVVAERSSLRWHEEDWRGRSREEQEKRLREYARAERESGFDMSEGPLHRYQVLRLADQEWQLVWSFHHILLDGWCLSLVLEEVYAIYDSLVRGEELALERPRPYRDYIGWLQQQDLKAAESYWRKRLAGFRARTQLNVETSNENETRSYGEQNLEVSKSATKALETLAREQQVTLNTVVQGAWAVLLSRYSAEHDVVYGVTVSGRPAELAGVEQMVGLFINSLPLRVQVESDAEVGTWLQRLQAEQAEMRQYEYSPLVEVQGWSEVDRGVGLFETLLAYANHPVTTMTGEQTGSSEAVVQHEQEWAMERTNYPLTLMVRPGERLLLRLLYEEQRYSAKTVETVLQHLDQVLVSMAAGAQQRLGDLRMLTPAEEELIVEEWNSTQEIYPAHYRVHELIDARAKLTPDTIAVVCEGEQITYAELIGRANQLANHLQRLGVGPDVLVGICVERSVAMIVGLLGILKAGGAYLPLDPDYPRERLSYMTEDAAIKVLLTQQHLLSRSPNSTHVVCLDSDWPEIEANSSTDDPVAEVDGQNIVYVIYTSGSTGKPKGVMVTNRSLVNLCYGLQSFFDNQSVRNTALITSLSFDISVNQIFPTLIFGKTLHVIPNHIKYDSRAVMRYSAEQKIHLMDCVPSYLNSVLTEINEAVQTDLRYLLVGGEKVERSLLQKVFAQLGEQTEVINIYGLTEITDINAFSRITAADLGQPITIGGPLQNTQIYITNDEGQLQPIGIAGELCIGGDGLSRGYRNRPDLTAEKFVANPYAEGALMCRTGDVGRWLEDGRIELFGRRDQQVKVNGYRLETGEIEATLDEHPNVVKSAVVAHRAEDGTRLVAYLVTTEKETMSGAEMREYLTRRVPAYMVPTFFIELEQMPLTPNGKVDRKALPAPDQSQVEIEREHVAARTPVEEMLTDIWSDVLGVEQISVHADFFDLGGHSLMATQVISRVRNTYNIELPLRRLFDTPTIARFAKLIEEQKDQVSEDPEPSVVPISRDAFRTSNTLLRTDFINFGDQGAG